jgi:uncharacterized protein (DUF1684 family)
MSDHGHDHADGDGNDHDHDHEEHGHHHQPFDWHAELVANREAAAHYYEQQFDWRGHQPPEGFDGPKFFPPAPEWRLAARLDATVPGAGDHAEIATSTGQVRHMHVAGDLVFDKDGAEHRLTAFVSERDGYSVLFVPFRDGTSGIETYGAGRYVEAPLDDEATDEPVELDFNYAYNPSCVFSPAYDCPFPPPQNKLLVAVRAGERLPYDAPK